MPPTIPDAGTLTGAGFPGFCNAWFICVLKGVPSKFRGRLGAPDGTLEEGGSEGGRTLKEGGAEG